MAALLVVPLVLGWLSVGLDRHRGPLIALALITGLLAASFLVAAIVMSSRLRSLSKTFGTEAVLQFHRLVGLLTATLAVAHVVLVMWALHWPLHLLWPPTAPPKFQLATFSLVSILITTALTLTRRRLKVRYGAWRALHGVLAVVAVGGLALHVYWLHHLLKSVSFRYAAGLLLLLIAGVLLTRWVIRPLRTQRHSYLVEQVSQVAPGVSTIELMPTHPRHPGMRFRPGQFAWLRLTGPLGVFRDHPFSMASSATDRRRLSFTIRHLGDFTERVARLAPGQRVYLDGPYGAFDGGGPEANGLLMIAWGVGITPMMSILRTHAARHNARPHILVMGARTEAELLFRDEIAAMTERLQLQVIEVVSHPGEDWTGRRGFIDVPLLRDVLAEYPDVRTTHAFVCGPPRMMDDVHAALLALGVQERQVSTEGFELV